MSQCKCSLCVVAFIFIQMAYAVNVLKNMTLQNSSLLPYAGSDWITHYDATHRQIWMLSGLNPGVEMLKHVMTYNLDTNDWSTYTDLSVAINGRNQYYTSAGDTIYFVGYNYDFGEFNIATETLLYDPHPTISLLIPVYAPCLVNDGRFVYIIGGAPNDYETHYAHLQIYDLLSQQWLSDTPSLQIARSRSACHIKDGRIHVFGGFIGIGNPSSYDYTNTIETLYVGSGDNVPTTISTQMWSILSATTLSTERSGSIAVSCDSVDRNIVYIVGSREEVTQSSDDTIDIFDINDQNIVSSNVTLNRARTDPSVVCVDNLLYVFGGANVTEADVGAGWEDWEVSNPLGAKPTEALTSIPSSPPTDHPSFIPSQYPSVTPSGPPSNYPSVAPSGPSSKYPSVTPSQYPSVTPSRAPSAYPSQNPSVTPSQYPSVTPSGNPSVTLSEYPSVAASDYPSAYPSNHPSVAPSDHPSVAPSENPSGAPSCGPSETPTGEPSAAPTETPSSLPSHDPRNSTSPTASGTNTVINVVLSVTYPSLMDAVTDTVNATMKWYLVQKDIVYPLQVDAYILDTRLFLIFTISHGLDSTQIRAEEIQDSLESELEEQFGAVVKVIEVDIYYPDGKQPPPKENDLPSKISTSSIVIAAAVIVAILIAVITLVYCLHINRAKNNEKMVQKGLEQDSQIANNNISSGTVEDEERTDVGDNKHDDMVENEETCNKEPSLLITCEGPNFQIDHMIVAIDENKVFKEPGQESNRSSRNFDDMFVVREGEISVSTSNLSTAFYDKTTEGAKDQKISFHGTKGDYYDEYHHQIHEERIKYQSDHK